MLLMNILVTIDANYIMPLNTMLWSLQCSNPNTDFIVYVANSSLTDEEFDRIGKGLNKSNFTFHSVKFEHELLNDAPVLKRITKETYYRLLAVDFLPECVDRILYIDPDTVIINSITRFYNIDFEGKLLAGAGHFSGIVEEFNKHRLNMSKDSRYINAGILMMNIASMRYFVDTNYIFNFIRKNIKKLFLADQDVINALYHDKTIYVDETVYNLDERVYRRIKDKVGKDYVDDNTVVIHYDGSSKPWHEEYKGLLQKYFLKYYNEYNEIGYSDKQSLNR